MSQISSHEYETILATVRQWPPETVRGFLKELSNPSESPESQTKENESVSFDPDWQDADVEWLDADARLAPPMKQKTISVKLRRIGREKPRIAVEPQSNWSTDE